MPESHRARARRCTRSARPTAGLATRAYAPRARARAPRSSCCASTDSHVLPGPQAKGVADWPPKGEKYPRTTDVDGGLGTAKAQRKILGETISLGTWPKDRAYDAAFDDAYKKFCAEIQEIMAQHDGQAWGGADGVRRGEKVNESIHKIQAGESQS